ncbi:flavin-containing monooxygenase [Specibacter cremeus]|uniref:flavin-containing monooxygenase n=1 Tax=Specibacter cremeus TaxID=1629051 RepID=UPI000F76D553|nr:NAD(P)/FAD-dependent oxidoreductase [Specibacter cremeus]
MDGHVVDSARSARTEGVDVDTVVVGAGQAGLATSYWLTQAGIEHRVFERRGTPGGAWQDRWDSFCLNTPNFGITVPGMPYDGPEPEAFMPKDDVVAYLGRYAETIGAPVQMDTDVTRVGANAGGFVVETSRGNCRARNVVLAAGGYAKPKLPAAAAQIPAHILQLHTDAYRNPELLPEGAVLVVGTGQSGGQIAEELHEAGREVHLAISSCPEAPRRYRGQDVFHWLMQVGIHGEAYGTSFPRVDQLPSPAARFGCNPLLTGHDGGHDICLRTFARNGVRLHGHFEEAGDGVLLFSDDIEDRLTAVEAGFGQRIQPVIDAYIAAAGIDAPADDRPPHDRFAPVADPRLDLEAAGVTSIIWATGFRLDFGWLDVPVLDAWGYPRHDRGVVEHPGLYAVGLPWLSTQASALLSGVGRDAAHVVEHLARTAR